MARKTTRIPVAHYTYRQRWVQAETTDAHGARAWAELTRREIVIADDADPKQVSEYLFHELVEAINHEYELELPHWQINILGKHLAQGVRHLMPRWW